jgi:hypothetical protein
MSVTIESAIHFSTGRAGQNCLRNVAVTRAPSAVGPSTAHTQDFPTDGAGDPLRRADPRGRCPGLRRPGPAWMGFESADHPDHEPAESAAAEAGGDFVFVGRRGYGERGAGGWEVWVDSAKKGQDGAGVPIVVTDSIVNGEA